MNTEKAKTFALTAFGFLCIAIAVQMFATPVTSQIPGGVITGIMNQPTDSRIYAVADNGDTYIRNNDGSTGAWSYHSNIFEQAGVVQTNSNSSVGEAKQLFR
jgi:hypothetical protein